MCRQPFSPTTLCTLSVSNPIRCFSVSLDADMIENLPAMSDDPEDTANMLPSDAAPLIHYILGYWHSKRKARPFLPCCEIDVIYFCQYWTLIFLVEEAALEVVCIRLTGAAYYGICGSKVIGPRIIDPSSSTIERASSNDYTLCLRDRRLVFQPGGNDLAPTQYSDPLPTAAAFPGDKRGGMKFMLAIAVTCEIIGDSIGLSLP